MRSWRWTENGKRVKIEKDEGIKRMKVSQGDVEMRENCAPRKWVQNMQWRMEREIEIYKAQMHEVNPYPCCDKRFKPYV
jgi:hypothetical protein